MNIYDINKLSLLDFPGRVSAIIFLSGCNMNCGYCYNSDLKIKSNARLSEEEVLDFLKSRVGKIDGVVITGGEPTINNELPSFIKKIKDLGLLVKLDTNGTNPKMIEYLIDNSLVDYIAMDIKTNPLKYSVVTNTKNNIEDILDSVDIIKNSNIEHEFRTTIYNIHTLDDLINIAKLVSPSKYFLQDFKKNEKVSDKNIFSKDSKTLEEYVITCNKYTQTNLRKK
jgi:pyruvate formate lyase activating enzyme